MGRLAPEQYYRFGQSCPGRLDLTFAGAEANVAASISLLGGSSRFVSALPHNALADACVRNLKGLGVDTRYVRFCKEGRMGLYFVETGANQRPSNVIYDRDHSAFSLLGSEDYPWEEILDGAGWLHISGITPALSQKAAEATLVAARRAREKGVTVSCDLNFRKKLWRWQPDSSPEQLARQTMRKILPFIDVLIGNEEDSADVLGIAAADTDVGNGRIAFEHYPQVAAQIVEQFPNISYVATTLRESFSATHNNWGAMLYRAADARASFAPLKEGEYSAYEIRNIVDRVGGGDSFAAGLIFALHSGECADDTEAIAFATAASCLAHSIKGDFNFSSKSEVLALARGQTSGRVVR